MLNLVNIPERELTLERAELQRSLRARAINLLLGEVFFPVRDVFSCQREINETYRSQGIPPPWHEVCENCSQRFIKIHHKS